MKNIFLLSFLSIALVCCQSTKNGEKNHEDKKLFSSKNRKPWKTKDDHFSSNRKNVGGSSPVQYRGKNGPKTGGGNSDGFASSKKANNYNTSGDSFRSKRKRGTSAPDGDSFTRKSRRRGGGGDPAGDSFVSAKKKTKGR